MENTETKINTNIIYFNKPSLLVRMKCTMIDTVVFIILMYVVSAILNSLNIESGTIRAFALVIIILYEPIMTSVSRTLGQKIMGIRVRKFTPFVKDKEKLNISIFKSMIRFVSKLLLGFISLLTIHGDSYGQAIHDKLGNSIMIKEK